jgi:hypothetical protein
MVRNVGAYPVDLYLVLVSTLPTAEPGVSLQASYLETAFLCTLVRSLTLLVSAVAR